MDRPDLDLLEGLLHARGGFSHREHVELTWIYLGRHSTDDAQRAMAAAIRRVAELHGVAGRYHETLTGAWVRLVAAHRAADRSTSFDEFIDGNRGLLDRSLLSKHYSRELLASEEARRRWLEPDLRPLPSAA